MRRYGKLYREPDHDSWLLAEDNFNLEDEMAEPLEMIERMEALAGRVLNNPRLTVENMKDFQADALELARLLVDSGSGQFGADVGNGNGKLVICRAHLREGNIHIELPGGGQTVIDTLTGEMILNPFGQHALGGEPEADPNESVPTPLIPEMGEPVG